MSDLVVNLTFRAGDLGATRVIRDIQDGLKGIRQTTKNIGTSTQHIKGMGKAGFNTGRGLSVAGDALSSIGRGALGITKDILGVGIAFEKSMKDVQAFGNFTGSETERLTKLIRDLGATEDFTAGQIAESAKIFAQAGFGEETIKDALEATLTLGIVMEGELPRATAVATAALAQFGLEGKDIARVTDVFAAGATSAATDVSQIGKAMEFVGTNAKTAGLSVETTTALIASLGTNAIRSGKAGRQLDALLGKLVTLGDTQRSSDFIRKFEIDPKKVRELLAVDEFGEVLGLIDRAFIDKGLTGPEKLAELTSAFGRQAARGMTGLLSALESGKFDEIAKKTLESDGAAKQMADTMKDNAAGAIKKLNSALEGLKLVIAEDILPIITPLIQDVTRIVKKIAEWAKNNPEATKTLVKVGAALGAISFIIGPIIGSLGTLVGVFGGLGGVARAAAPVLRAVGLGLGGIFTWLAPLVVGLDLLYAKISDTKSVTESLLETFEAGKSAVGFLKGLGIIDTKDESEIPQGFKEGAGGIVGTIARQTFGNEDTRQRELDNLFLGKRERDNESIIRGGLLGADPISEKIRPEDRNKTINQLLGKIEGFVREKIDINIKVDQDGRVTSVDKRSTGSSPSLSAGLTTEGI